MKLKDRRGGKTGGRGYGLAGWGVILLVFCYCLGFGNDFIVLVSVPIERRRLRKWGLEWRRGEGGEWGLTKFDIVLIVDYGPHPTKFLL